jgi:hypothetical protein
MNETETVNKCKSNGETFKEERYRTTMDKTERSVLTLL